MSRTRGAIGLHLTPRQATALSSLLENLADIARLNELAPDLSPQFVYNLKAAVDHPERRPPTRRAFRKFFTAMRWPEAMIASDLARLLSVIGDDWELQIQCDRPDLPERFTERIRKNSSLEGRRLWRPASKANTK